MRAWQVSTVFKVTAEQPWKVRTLKHKGTELPKNLKDHPDCYMNVLEGQESGLEELEVYCS